MSGSKNYSQEDLLQLLEDLQTENEDLRQANTEKEQTLQYLTERIETLSESDRQLKNAERLLKESETLKAQAQEEAEAMRVRASKAEAAERRANEALEEARAKDRAAETHIQSRVADKVEQLERQSAQKLREAKERTVTMSSIGMVGLCVYSAVLTLIWLTDHWNTVKTLPEWFVSRAKNIKAIAGAIKAAFLWIHDRLPNTWPDAVRYLIPIILFTAAAVGLFFLVKLAIKAVKEFHYGLWFNTYGDKKRLKKAVIIALCTCCVSLSILLVEHWNAPHLHWFSWYLIFALTSTIIYLKVSK